MYKAMQIIIGIIFISISLSKRSSNPSGMIGK